MAEWANYFVAQVGAAAALAGLVFVGVSINLAKVIEYSGLPGLAAQAILVLLEVLVVSSLLLIPTQPTWVAGIEVTLIGIMVWGIIGRIQLVSWKDVEPQYHKPFMIRIITSQLATLPFIVGGIFMLAQNSDGLYGIVVANIFCFIKAFFDAWVLLIEINR